MNKRVKGNPDLKLDVGQANEIKLALRRFDYDGELIKQLCETDVLGAALDIMRGDAIVVPVERTIDCDATPVLKEENVIVRNRTYGLLKWSDVKLGVFSPNGFKDVDCKERNTSGEEQLLHYPSMTPLYAHSAHRKLPGIAVRDYLLQHQHLIRWEETFPLLGDIVLFWGTIAKNKYCYWVPGIRRGMNGKWSEYNRRVEVDGFTQYYDDIAVFL